MIYAVAFIACLGVLLLRRRLLTRGRAAAVASAAAAATDPFCLGRGVYARDPLTGRRDRLEL